MLCVCCDGCVCLCVCECVYVVMPVCGAHVWYLCVSVVPVCGELHACVWVGVVSGVWYGVCVVYGTWLWCVCVLYVAIGCLVYVCGVWFIVCGCRVCACVWCVMCVGVCGVGMGCVVCVWCDVCGVWL